MNDVLSILHTNLIPHKFTKTKTFFSIGCHESTFSAGFLCYVIDISENFFLK